MITYFGFSLNQAGDPAPWSAQELTNFESIIDLLGQGLDYTGIGVVSNPRLFDMCLGVKGGGALANLGIGMSNTSTPRCPIDVKMSASGYAGVLPAGTGMCFEHSTISSMQFLTAAGGVEAIYFGIHTDIDKTFMDYNDATGLFRVVTNAGAGKGQMSLSANGVSIGSSAAVGAWQLEVVGADAKAYIYQNSVAGNESPLHLQQAATDRPLMDVYGVGGVGILSTIKTNNVLGAIVGSLYIRYNTGGGWNDGRIAIYAMS